MINEAKLSLPTQVFFPPVLSGFFSNPFVVSACTLGDAVSSSRFPQVSRVAKSLSHECKFSSALIAGGHGDKDQAERLNMSVDLLVGSPGRLLQVSRIEKLFKLRLGTEGSGLSWSASRSPTESVKPEGRPSQIRKGPFR